MSLETLTHSTHFVTRHNENKLFSSFCLIHSDTRSVITFQPKTVRTHFQLFNKLHFQRHECVPKVANTLMIICHNDVNVAVFTCMCKVTPNLNKIRQNDASKSKDSVFLNKHFTYPLDCLKQQLSSEYQAIFYLY